MTVLADWQPIGLTNKSFSIDFTSTEDEVFRLITGLPPRYEQLEFDFDLEYGSVDEAKTIFDLIEESWHYGNELELPPGWSFIGSGGTRRVYRAPSGICYKVCYSNSEEDAIAWNEWEHENFRRIKREGKLPSNWRVPKSYLHKFRTNVTRWEYSPKADSPKVQVTEEVTVTVLACEYVKGSPVGGFPSEAEAIQRKEDAVVVFSKIGLIDLGGQNVILTDEGNYYIIDAAERMSI